MLPFRLWQKGLREKITEHGNGHQQWGKLAILMRCLRARERSSSSSSSVPWASSGKHRKERPENLHYCFTQRVSLQPKMVRGTGTATPCSNGYFCYLIYISVNDSYSQTAEAWKSWGSEKNIFCLDETHLDVSPEKWWVSTYRRTPCQNMVVLFWRVFFHQTLSNMKNAKVFNSRVFSLPPLCCHH